MAIQRKLRRDPKSDNDLFTGSEGELVQDTDNNRVIVHDGIKQGGYGVPNFLDLMKNTLVEGTATGTDTYSLLLPYFSDGYEVGTRITVKFTNANTGPSTLNVNNQGPISIVDEDGNDFTGGELEAGSTYSLEYNGADFRFYQGISSAGVNYLETQVFTSSGTWIMPPGCKYIDVIVTGGGGGGGNAGSNASASGGGGGTSSFGSHCSSTGGGGGEGGSTSNSPSGFGDGINGDVNIKGGRGSAGKDTGVGGDGGSSFWGGGGTGFSVTSNGHSGSAYGSGGSGACSIGTNSPYGGGGGAGGTSMKTIFAELLATTETVTVGGGGSGGSQVGSDKRNGGIGRGGIVIIKAYG